VVNQRNSSPPVDHWRRTVATSSSIMMFLG
jgi:hypothetical protein